MLRGDSDGEGGIGSNGEGDGATDDFGEKNGPLECARGCEFGEGDGEGDLRPCEEGIGAGDGDASEIFLLGLSPLFLDGFEASVASIRLL